MVQASGIAGGDFLERDIMKPAVAEVVLADHSVTGSVEILRDRYLPTRERLPVDRQLIVNRDTDLPVAAAASQTWHWRHAGVSRQTTQSREGIQGTSELRKARFARPVGFSVRPTADCPGLFSWLIRLISTLIAGTSTGLPLRLRFRAQ